LVYCIVATDIFKMTNNRPKNSIEVSKILYLKDKEIYFLGLAYLRLAGILKLPSIRAHFFKTKNTGRLSIKFRCILTSQRLISSRSFKMTRMVYKFMLNASKMNGIRVAKR
jgi:hypothetical protein